VRFSMRDLSLTENWSIVGVCSQRLHSRLRMTSVLSNDYIRILKKINTFTNINQY